MMHNNLARTRGDAEETQRGARADLSGADLSGADAAILRASASRRQGQRLQALARTRLLLALAAALIALPAVWVLLTRGLPVIADDAPVHLMRLFLFDRHVRAGDVLPRWLPELYTGYGYPLFTFYAPAMYYVAEWLHLARVSLVDGYRFTYALAVIAGAIGAAFLASDLYAPPRASPPASRAFWPGLLAATAYTYSIYLLANVYVRGAFGEVGAQALLPWLFWAFRRLLTTPRTVPALVMSATLLALLVATHTITFLLVLPCLAAYVIFLAVAHKDAAPRLAGRLAPPLCAALLAAMLSAAIWLPQLLARGALSTAAWSTQLLLENLWRWRDFGEFPLRFRALDGGQTPYHLSAVQLLLALTGLLCVRRRTGEWWFWVGVLSVCVLLMSPVSAPLWASIEALAIIQFPWRLLSLAGLATALLAAGVVTAFPTPAARAIGATLIIAFIVMTQAPRAVETPHLAASSDITLSLASITRFETSEPAYGAGYDDEFLPRWAAPAALAAPAPAARPVDAVVKLEGVQDDGVRLKTDAPQPFALRWSQFYFPQVRAALDKTSSLPVLPDDRTGLVEVMAPPGAHALDIQRDATTSQQAGAILALVGLLLLLAALALAARRVLLISAVFALIVGLVWMVGARSPAPLEQRTTAEFPLEAAPGLDLLGVRAALDAASRLQIAPTWFVRANQPDLLFHWKLVDADGAVVSELRTAPRFGVWRSSAWAPGDVVQDAAELALPPGLPAGVYTLVLSLVEADRGVASLVDQDALQITLPAIPTVEATHEPAAPFGQDNTDPVATLAGLRVTVNGEPVKGQFVAAPGDSIAVDLLWQPLTPDRYPYQSIVEIVDHAQRKVAAQDLQVGWRDTVLDLWRPYLAPHERTTLRLPDDAANGLYTLRVGLRDRRTDQRLSVFDQTGQPQGDFYAAPAFKVLAPLGSRPATVRAGMFGDAIELDGYTQAPAAAVRPGDALTVTLFYTARAVMPIDYTRFLQLHSPALGMAAQADAMPQNGANPTSAWVKGERIADAAVLPIAPDAAPGKYQLLLGFYDAEHGGVRLPATDAAGAVQPDQAIVLAEIVVAPSSQ
ncbi:MAG: hypothetical protein IAE81_18240 [Caldilineaceae bacterium]|nr:hypothetical protein [Caldilineaceae bacterium]